MFFLFLNETNEIKKKSPIILGIYYFLRKSMIKKQLFEHHDLYDLIIFLI